MTENEFMRGKLLDYYSTLNVEGVITELEMESEMDNISLNMSELEVKRKYKRLKGLGIS
jgi:hypothetical protein